ncbi:MAG: Crossover junction endodeoxyribonuclease RuvC [Bacteroidetes bacterium]|nr:Crossover junction endodeoxyribonuclease RuvC [Bacteroidota bacterium]
MKIRESAMPVVKVPAVTRTIIGIDPGTIVMGYGIIEVTGQKMTLVSMGVVQLSKYEDHLDRLRVISEKVKGLIEQYKPDSCAIEAPFFGKNVQSMLKLGRAQGVCIATALIQGVLVTEYSPKKIKQSITGNGNSSKEQVAAMLQQLCKFEIQPKFLDATDGLAAAVCHHFQGNTTVVGGKKFSGWGDFVKNNEKRVK